jgi:hypothetical protein
MRPFARVLAPGLVGPALLYLAGLGCDSRPAVDTSTTEATVKGTVTVKGKPATKGKVVFDPSNYKRKNEAIRTADIGPGGTYEIKTLVGTNSVKVDSPEAAKAASLYDTYTYDVPSGTSTFDIVIPKPSN